MKKFKVIQSTVASLMAVSMIGLSACDLLFGDNPAGDGNTYEVVLNANDGELLRDLSSYVSGEATPLPAAERNHYIFDGWYADENFSGSAVQSIPKSSIGDVEYWAKWTPETYGITYYIDGVEYEADGFETYAYNSEKSLPTTTKDNYSLDGWYESSSCTGNTVSSIVAGEYGNKIYYAKWTPNTYNVNLELNGGKLANGVVFNGYVYGLEETLPTPTRSDYRFDGWYEKSDFSGSAVTVISKGSTGDKTYYAKWTLTAAIEILNCGAYEEGAYVEISPSDHVNLNNIKVYYKLLDDTGAYKVIDSELIREIENKDGSTYIRADIVGISEGAYSIKVTADGSEVFREVTVTSYDRSGYAHFNTNEGVGAYNNDGTPKSGAVIVYVTEETKNSVKATIGSKSYTGLAKILAAATTGTPVIVRIIGKISAPTWAHAGDKQLIEYSKAG
ncbi:MAG: InlB B-repeat-containing protein, partial [Clostridia bacterium]|nr:InlB B-repeat-containing protein [Clostridia bacterium]